MIEKWKKIADNGGATGALLPGLSCFWLLNWKHLVFNPFVSSAPFLYPLKTSENLTVFWCFQEVDKGCIGNEWIKTCWCLSVKQETKGKNWTKLLFLGETQNMVHLNDPFLVCFSSFLRITYNNTSSFQEIFSS